MRISIAVYLFLLINTSAVSGRYSASNGNGNNYDSKNANQSTGVDMEPMWQCSTAGSCVECIPKVDFGCGEAYYDYAGMFWTEEECVWHTECIAKDAQRLRYFCQASTNSKGKIEAECLNCVDFVGQTFFGFKSDRWCPKDPSYEKYDSEKECKDVCKTPKEDRGPVPNPEDGDPIWYCGITVDDETLDLAIGCVSCIEDFNCTGGVTQLDPDEVLTGRTYRGRDTCRRDCATRFPANRISYCTPDFKCVSCNIGSCPEAVVNREPEALGINAFFDNIAECRGACINTETTEDAGVVNTEVTEPPIIIIDPTELPTPPPIIVDPTDTTPLPIVDTTTPEDFSDTTPLPLENTTSPEFEETDPPTVDETTVPDVEESTTDESIEEPEETTTDSLPPDLATIWFCTPNEELTEVFCDSCDLEECPLEVLETAPDVVLAGELFELEEACTDVCFVRLLNVLL